MKGTRVASRYAKSLINLAIERGELEKAYADMQLVSNTVKGSKELALFLKNPIIKADKKEAVLVSLFEGKISKITKEFIDIIARKRRELYLGEIAEDFVAQYRTNKKILTAVITTASGLDETLRGKVLEIVKGSARSEVELVEKIDKDLIGGFVLRIGDKQVDTSIARKLKQLTMNFSENPYIKEY